MTYRNLSDQDLFCLLKEGDCRAYTEVYNRYSESLYAHVLKRLNDREEAKDVIQELYANIWANKEKIVIQGQLSSYLYKSVRNRVINILAHKEVATNYIDSLEQEIPNYKEQTDYLIRQNQLAELIEKEINFLPSKMREVFTLSRKRYLTHREIADKLNISELTVKKQVTNALKILRSRLDLFIRCFFFFIPFV
jgi:RNA polymerase sigma-70 factor (ECF subfamily)